MKAKDEIANLQRKLEDGSLPPDEPLFVLRAQDAFAAGVVDIWATFAEMKGTPAEKVKEARELLSAMRLWPVKQIPGRPDTRTKD